MSTDLGIGVLLEEYSSKLENLIDLINIKPALADDEEDTQIAIYSDVAKGAVHLAALCRESKEQCERLRSSTLELEELKTEAEEMNNEIEILFDKIPKYMPSQVTKTEVEKPDSPVKKISREKKKNNSSKSETVQKKSKKGDPPHLSYITGKEFESVPKYMKGRIMYSDINKCVDNLNQSAVGKYNIVNKTKGLNDYQRRKKIDYLQLEDKDTEHVHFITDSDITEFTSTKPDKHFYSLLTILRHCGRIKQSRTGKVSRYILNATTG